jgi:uncharacterized membrane protein HdeD (DUF308 family)
MAEHSPVEIVRHASTLSILWGVLLIVFGILAVGSPFLAAVAVNVVIAWLIILAGVVHVILAFHAHRAGRLIWKLLVGLAYLFFGAYLIMHPVLGVATLTLVLASLFLIEGILDTVLFFQMRSLRGSGWVLVEGIITLLLGLMIYLQWPSSAVWAITSVPRCHAIRERTVVSPHPVIGAGGLRVRGDRDWPCPVLLCVA